MTLAYDAQTPEQISIRAPLSRAVATGTTVAVEYKLTSSATWLDALPLFQVASGVGYPTEVVDAFAGAIFDLLPGQTYDVRLTVSEPGQTDAVLTGTRATRALPAVAGAPTDTATPANVASKLAALSAGDVLELSDGAYDPITISVSGTSGSPIYIRGATRSGVVITAGAAESAVTWGNASHVILENLTLEGTGVSSPDPTDTAAFCAGITFLTDYDQTNCTIRNLTATGFDRFCKNFTPVFGRLIYNCTITGPNSWAETYQTNAFTGAVNGTWNDDGVGGPGEGNCFFDSTITGHGDVLKLGTSSGTYFTAACGIWRIACDRTGDDPAEFDEGAGNLWMYDCYVKSAGTNFSVDGIFGGPVYIFRNRFGLTTRSTVKPTSTSQNVAILANDFVRTLGASPNGVHNFQAATSGTNSGWIVKNNIIVYRGATGDLIRMDCDLTGLDWDYNYLYPPTGRAISLGAGRSTYTGLTAAKAALAPLMAHDVAGVSNPWAQTITLGSDYTTEYTGSVDWHLLADSTARSAGVALPNITDGHSGAAPDIGAVITGRPMANAGDPSDIAWLPAAGASAIIGYAQNSHPQGLPATLEELAPKYQSWAVTPGDDSPWDTAAGKNVGTISDWSGPAWDQKNRRAISMGGGHVDMCIPAPYAYNVGMRAFEWLDQPLPTNALESAADPPSKANTAAAYTNGEWDADESTWLGDSTSWPAGLRRPGVIQPEVQHMQYGLVWVPGEQAGNVDGVVVNCTSPTGKYGGAVDLKQRTYFDLDDRRWKLSTNFQSHTGYYAGGACWFGGSINRVFALMAAGSTLKNAIDNWNPSTKTWATTYATADVNVVYACGGLVAHLDSGLLLSIMPSSSGGDMSVTGAVGTQFRIRAVSASAVVAGSHTWATLTATAAASWPLSKIDVGGGSFRECYEALGAVYCPRNGCLYISDWRHGTTTLWKVTPPAGAVTTADYLGGTWVISTETFSPSISNLSSSGASVAAVYPYNRMVWDEHSGCLIGVPPYYLQPPWAIRPAGV